MKCSSRALAMTVIITWSLLMRVKDQLYCRSVPSCRAKPSKVSNFFNFFASSQHLLFCCFLVVVKEESSPGKQDESRYVLKL